LQNTEVQKENVQQMLECKETENDKMLITQSGEGNFPLFINPLNKNNYEKFM